MEWPLIKGGNLYLSLLVSGGVTKADRYIYRCSVKVVGKPGMERAHAMLLRVKGKYAALWPTIGIIIEVP